MHFSLEKVYKAFEGPHELFARKSVQSKQTLRVSIQTNLTKDVPLITVFTQNMTTYNINIKGHR